MADVIGPSADSDPQRLEQLLAQVRDRGAPDDHVALARLRIEQQFVDPTPNGFAEIQVALERAVAAHPDDPDILFHLGFSATLADAPAAANRARRRLEALDPVGAIVLDAISCGDEQALEDTAQRWLVRAQDEGADGLQALDQLTRLAELRRDTAALASYGFEFLARGESARARVVAVMLPRLAGEWGHVAHFNSAGLFAATGDTARAFAGYEHASRAARSAADHDDVVAGLARIGVGPLLTARACSPAGIAARLRSLAGGVTDLRAFGPDLGALVKRYVAARGPDAAARLIRAHPQLLSPPAVRTVVSVASVMLHEAGDREGQRAAHLLADAAEVGLAHASATFDLGAREHTLPTGDELAIEHTDDADVFIARLRLAVADPTFCDHTRRTRAAAELELGRLLLRRAEQRQDVVDLVDAVELIRRACSSEPTWNARFRLALGEHRLFQRTGSAVSLERTRYLVGELIGAIAVGDSNVVPCLVLRGLVGLERFEISAQREDLEVTLLAADAALALLEHGSLAGLSPDEHGGAVQQASALRAHALDALAAQAPSSSPLLSAFLGHDALVMLALVLDAIDRVDATAIDQIRACFTRLVDACDPAGGVRAMVAWADAEALLLHHRLVREPEALRRAVNQYATLIDRPDLPPRMHAELTHALLLVELGVDGDADAYREAVHRLGQLTDPGAAGSDSRLGRRAALRWGDAAWRGGRMDDAAYAYDTALALRGDVLATHALRADQLEELRGFQSAVARAPLAHLHRGDVWAAAISCERARAVVVTAVLAGSRQPVVDGTASDRLQDAISAAAANDPLVYLLAADGGFAIVVDGAGATVVELPELTESAVRERACELAGSPPTAHRLLEITRWLWDAGMGAVAGALAGHAAVNLVPTGALSLLPLHAAWRPDPASADGRRHLVDDVVVRYAPNARALLRERHPDESGDARLRISSALTVSNPEPSRLPHLAGAQREVEHIRERLSGTALDAADASRGGVLGEWGKHDVMHFACHGQAVPADPMRSAILLAGDQRLTAAEILDAHPGGTPLIVLSACETAMTDITLPDEVITVQSVFLAIGARGVVGSLWAVDDEATADLMVRYYDELLGGADDPAAALRSAQQQMRMVAVERSSDRRRDLGSDPHRTEPLGATNWMAFTYTGG
jgi:hypothetical protein